VYATLKLPVPEGIDRVPAIVYEQAAPDVLVDIQHIVAHIAHHRLIRESRVGVKIFAVILAVETGK
jgi:hypothetical protein